MSEIRRDGLFMELVVTSHLIPFTLPPGVVFVVTIT
jgi:hypothetical protein